MRPEREFIDHILYLVAKGCNNALAFAQAHSASTAIGRIYIYA